MAGKKTQEKFIEEVFELVGEEYTVLGKYAGADKKVLIRHNRCKTEYEVLPLNFLRGKRCPKCQHRSYKKTTEEFKKEVFNLVGNEYSVLGEYTRAKDKISIEHNKCCHIYEITPHDFLQGHRCPRCNESKGEKTVREYLESEKLNYKAQYKIIGCKNIRPLPFDFAILDKNDNLLTLIEFDGMQHFRKAGFSNGTEKIESLKINEKIKNDYCKSHNIPLIRIPYRLKSIRSYLDMKLRQVAPDEL